MDVFENPFYLLGATPRDRKSRLIELSENLALNRDPEAVASARNTLINTRHRLVAEVAWFPGVSPNRIAKNLDLLRRRAVAMELTGFPALCSANFVAASLSTLAPGGAQPLQDAIASLAQLVERFDADDVLRDINEDRQVSGFPAITDLALVEMELTSRKRHYQRVITNLLDSTLATEHLVGVYERLISDGTSNGEDEAPQLLSELVDTYEIKTKAELDKRSEEISAVVDKTRAIASKNGPVGLEIRDSTEQLISLLRIWDMIAQPVQLLKKSKGLDHPESTALAFKVRSLAIDLFNDHDYLDESTLLSKELEKLFAEVPVVLDSVSEDLQTLDSILMKRKQRAKDAAEEKAEFAKAVTYETTFGLVFKDRFRISPEGIEWNNTRTSLESIKGFSWGAIRHSTNGVYTGTKYHIHYFNTAPLSIEFSDGEKYNAIVQCLWRGVGVRLLFEMMATCKNDGSVRFGSVEVRDDGIVLSRSRLFKSDEHAFHTWPEVRKGIHDGALCFTSQKDKRFKANLSFISTYNVHVLDFALDRIWEGKASRLSDIFGKK